MKRIPQFARACLEGLDRAQVDIEVLRLCSDCGSGDCFLYSQGIYTSVMIAPEASDNKGGSLSSLASLAGISLNTSSGSDAIYPDLYSDIVSSTPFVIGLFDVLVRDIDGEIKTTIYDYMDEYQRASWCRISYLPLSRL